MLIPLARAAYKRGDLPEVPLVNAFFESTPTNQEDQVSILGRFGLAAFAMCAGAGVRGIFYQDGSVGSVAIIVSGTSLYKVTTAGAVTSISGTVLGADLVRMAGSAAKVLISNGLTLQETDGATLSAVSLPDSFAPGDVGYINGRFLVVKAGGHRYYWSGPGDTVFDPLDYASAEMVSDPLEALGVATDEVWFFGTASVEVSQPTADPDAPFVRVQGRAYEMGCARRHTVAKFSNGIVWVGADKRVYTTLGGPLEISHSGVVEAIGRSAPADLRAWRAVVDGHEWYILTLTGATWAYDASTRLWTRFESYGRSIFRAHLGAPIGQGRYIAGDSESGQIWLVDPALTVDGTEPLPRTVSGMVTVKKPTRCNRVRLDISVGTAGSPTAYPLIVMRYSDDDGATWSTWLESSLGRQGDRNRTVEWRKLGTMGLNGSRRRIFEWRLTDALGVTLRRAELD